jgi:hypothetical protein
MGGPVQTLYEGLRAETLGEDVDRGIDPSVREQFTQAGFIALFPRGEVRNAGWMPPFQIEMEGADKDSCSLRTFVEIFRLIIERSVENLPVISWRTNREHFSAACGNLRQGFLAPPAEARHHRKPAGRVA